MPIVPMRAPRATSHLRYCDAPMCAPLSLLVEV